MILRPYYYFDLGCASYLFGCGTLGRCAVVVTDLKRGSDTWFVLTGDTLFVGAVVPPKPVEMERILALNRGQTKTEARA